MTPRELGDESTRIVAGGDELTMERIFDAPRELVWTAMTSAEHVRNWWGPRGTSGDVREMDVRVGGRWHIAGEGMGFAGEFLEVDPPARLVRTSAPDFAGGEPPAVETITFEDLGGRTKMVYQARFPSAMVLTFALNQGMTKGVLEQFDRLAELLVSLA